MSKKKLSVFLCHASPDKDKAREVHAWLTAGGFAPWLDEFDLVPGAPWRDAIRAAISSSDVFLALLSEHSISKRGFVQAEIKIALEELENVPSGHTFVVPARLSPCEVPSELSSIHAADLATEQGRARLLHALNVQASRLGRASALTEQQREQFHYDRVEAIRYTLEHDDGASLRNIASADTVLVGLSGSGKTSLAVVLAVAHSLKVANYPVTPEDIKAGMLPEALLPHLSKAVALVTPSPAKLSQGRSIRRPGSRYASIENCTVEWDALKSFTSQYKIPLLDADFSRSSLEELATYIAKHHVQQKLLY